ncbi:glycosyltransferase family 4 protein [candidate division WOR-3 bacterium]|nr:glycosyltransferase family 4 protein [candidate division WOR-3 bacterium]
MARYLQDTLIEMMAASPKDDFVLYAPAPIDVPLPQGKWRVCIPRKRPGSLPGHWLRDTVPRVIAEDGIDVFWGQNTVMPLRLRRPCRRVLTVHDVTALVYPHTMQFRHRLSWALNFRAAVRAADAIVIDSQATARLVHRFFPTASPKLVVIHAGCPRELRPVTRCEVLQQTAERLGLPGKFMLTVGTIEPRKDYSTLLHIVRRDRALPLLVIAGVVGWRSGAVLRLIRTAESEGRVRYVGRVDDRELACLYSLACIMVYPSVYEGFGLPVVEAMACGCPVLCSWSSSLPEVGGTAVRYFRPHDVDDLATKAAELLRNHVLLSEMSCAGIAQAARFSFEVAARSLLDVLRGSSASHLRAD